MVRLWQAKDRPGAISTVREVFEEYGFTWDEETYHADLYDVPRHYLEEGHLFFVEEIDGAVAGTVAIEFFPLIPGLPGHVVEYQGKKRVAGTDCSLERLYVRPTARRAGVGGRLMNAVIEAAKSNERRAMEIWSDKRFADAHRLYEKWGAVLAGERICDDPDLSPEWGLYLNLP